MAVGWFSPSRIDRCRLGFPLDAYARPTRGSRDLGWKLWGNGSVLEEAVGVAGGRKEAVACSTRAIEVFELCFSPIVWPREKPRVCANNDRGRAALCTAKKVFS